MRRERCRRSVTPVLEAHEHRVAAAVAVEDLLAVRQIFTGRPSISAALATTISWLNGSLLPPKPPPFGVAITRMCAGSSASTFVSARCR
jgi:hypothetical protein